MSPPKKMETDAIKLRVFRRNGQLFVNPMAISPNGFKALETVIVVDDGKKGLLEALQAAEELALEVTKKPRGKRFPQKHKEPDWSVAGVSSWEEFLKGTTSIGILRAFDETALSFFIPKGRDTLGVTTLNESLAPETPLSKVAAAVGDMFARADKKKPALA